MQVIPVTPVRRVNGAFQQLNVISMTEEFERRPRIMRTVPYMMRGVCREAVRVALRQILLGRPRGEPLQEERGTEVVSFSSPDSYSSAQAAERANRFAIGQWLSLLAESNKFASDGWEGEDATQVTRRRRCVQNEWRLEADCLPHGKLLKELILFQALSRLWPN